MKNELQLSAKNQSPKHLPELAAVVAAQTHMPDDPAENAAGPAQITPSQLPPRIHAGGPVGVSRAGLSQKSFVKVGRLVNIGDHLAPSFHHGLAGFEESEIGI